MQFIDLPLFVQMPESDEPEFFAQTPTTTYLRETTSTGQPVTDGRQLLRPELFIEGFKCDAVVDWIEFAFETPGEHQALNIRRSLMKVVAEELSRAKSARRSSPIRVPPDYAGIYVSGLARTERHTGTHFLIRVQDATPGLVDLIREHLEQKYNVSRADGRDPFVMTGLEVSVDFYKISLESLEDLAMSRVRMSDLLRKHLLPAPEMFAERSRRPRVYCSDGQTYFLVRDHMPANAAAQKFANNATPEQLHWLAAEILGNHLREVPADRTLYVGDKREFVELRLQDKSKNRLKDGDARKIPLGRRRSRIEIRFEVQDVQEVHVAAGKTPEMTALGLPTVSSVRGFKFEQLRKIHFNFMLPTLPGDGDDRGWSKELAVFSRTGVTGLTLLHRAQALRGAEAWSRRSGLPRPSLLGKRGRNLDFKSMNQKVETALRGLTRAWRPRRASP